MIYEFSDLTLDLDRHLLTRGGEPVKLTKLSFKALQVLVQAAPALISHDELIDQVWGPRRVITLDNLAQRIKTLRQSLGDDPNEPVYIEGVRGEGYRLVPEVRIQPPQTSSHASVRTGPRILVAGLVAILAGLLIWLALDRPYLTEGKSVTTPANFAPAEVPIAQRERQPAIAVLPFANLSEDPANLFFTDGIHDDLLTRISKIQDIKTISRTSVMTYRDSDKKLGTIAKELGVSTILEGGVQRSGDQVRINLQLIEAETDAHVWAQTYTRKLTATNVFVIQAEIAEAVAGVLQAILTDDERGQLEKFPTTNLQALDAYFMGNQYYNQATSEGYTKAIEAYQRAVELDPQFSSAYSKQALAVLEQVWNTGFPNKDQLEKSRPLIDRAILLDPQSSEAFTALGRWYAHFGDIQEAERAYEQAMALEPSSVIALVNYGNLVQWNKSDPASAIELYERAIELDPQNISLRVQLAEAMRTVGRIDEGIRIMEGIIEGQPESAAGYRVLASLYSDGKFRHDKGIRAMRRAFELDLNHPMNSFGNAYMHWRLGDYDNTALWMNHIAKLVPDSEEARVYRGWAFIAQRNFESAREEFESSNSRSFFYWVGIFYLGAVDTAEGRPEDAIERYTDYASEFDGRPSNANFYFGIAAVKAYRAMGEQEKAQALIDQLISTLEASPPLTYHDSAIHEASIYALAGQTETAIAILEEWVNRGGATASLQQNIRHGLDVLKDDPRYQSILRTVDDRLSEQKANLARWEASGEMPPIPSAVKEPR
jgi:TolB-like protein/DNA-binding winged helix-turn-helix (wHTH) protein/predicted Zn-dependent protease